jgi:hypothetical protein
VFQFALRGLETERSFLSRNNWTFRFHPPSLEFVGSLQDHLPGSARDNLEQFVSFFPEVGSLIDDHDARVEHLFRECQSFHAALVNSPSLLQVYRSIASEATSTLGSDISNHFGAYKKESDFVAILAQELVNNIVELPSHYANALLWNHYRDRLRVRARIISHWTALSCSSTSEGSCVG